MKRFRVYLGLALCAAALAGCDTGGSIEEGVPKDVAPGAGRSPIEDMMKGMGNKMTKGTTKKPAANPDAGKKAAAETPGTP